MALLIWVICSPLFAEETKPQTEVDAIKQEALNLEGKVVDVESRALDRVGPATMVFLGAGGSSASITAVSLVIDDALSASHRLDPDETQELVEDRTYRVGRFSLAPGKHRVHAEVVLQYPGDTQPQTLTLDGSCEIPALASDLVLIPNAKSLLAKPALRLQQKFAGTESRAGFLGMRRLWNVVRGADDEYAYYQAGSRDDPRLGSARLLVATRDYFKAIVLLEQIPRQAPDVALTSNYYQILTEALTDYGALKQAQDSYLQTVGAGIGASEAAQLRLGIAEAYYQRQDYIRAERALGAAPSRRSKLQFAAWLDLKGRILMAQGQFSEAYAVLKATDMAADFDSYVRYYNYGIALIVNGLVPQGITVLDRVGSVVSNDRDMLALRDSANLALGSYLLQNGQGATAIPILERIEINGRYSDRALLNLGWAWLAPPGQQQIRTMLGDERTVGPPPESVGALHSPLDSQNLYQRYHLRPFIRAKLEGDKAARIKRALAIWSELIARDAGSEPVQEGFLAAALALDDLGAHTEATELYSRAVTALESSRRSLDDCRNYVQSEQWVIDLLSAGNESTRFDPGLRNLPRPAIAMLLDDLFAGSAFQSGLREFQDLEVLSANLNASDAALSGFEKRPVGDSARSSPDIQNADSATTLGWDAQDLQALHESLATLNRRINSAKSDEVAVMRQELLSEVDHKQRFITRLLGGAHLEVARAYDGATQQAE